MFTTRKRAVVSVINDLATDNRVLRVCSVLREMGYDVILIGRLLPGSPPLHAWPYRTIRMKLLFSTGPAFYFFFNLRLFFRLLFMRTDLLYANDLDTLLPNFLLAKLKNKALIYDSHELFCEVPELKGSPIKRRIWKTLEGSILPKLKYCITVNHSIATIFRHQYGVDFSVVRNIGDAPARFHPISREALGLPGDKKIILLQGAGINVDRGAEELVESMEFIDNALLLIIGSGDVWHVLERKKSDPRLEEKIRLIPRMSADKLRHYTYNADLGVSIDKNNNENYRNSLPNKIFDYLQAGIPVLASRLPEVSRILEAHGAGVFIDNHNPRHIAEKIRQVLESNDFSRLRTNAREASAVFSWQNEKKELEKVIAGATR